MTLRPHATPSTPHVITSSGMTEVVRDGRFYLVCGVTEPELAEALVTERIERGEMGLDLTPEMAELRDATDPDGRRLALQAMTAADDEAGFYDMAAIEADAFPTKDTPHG